MTTMPADKLWDAVESYLPTKNQLTEPQLNELGTVTRLNYSFFLRNYPAITEGKEPMTDEVWKHFINWLKKFKKDTFAIFEQNGSASLITPGRAPKPSRSRAATTGATEDSWKEHIKDTYVCDGCYFRRRPSGGYKRYSKDEYRTYLTETCGLLSNKHVDETRAVFNHLKEECELDETVKELYGPEGILPDERTYGNLKALNVSNHRVMEPSKKKVKVITGNYVYRFFLDLLGPEQAEHFFAYWRRLYIDRRALDATYTQACVFEGKQGGGKSAAADAINASLGGGSFSAKGLVKGGTFNGPELRASMLILDDVFIEEKFVIAYLMWLNEMIVEPRKRSEDKNLSAVMVKAHLPIIILANSNTEGGRSGIPRYDANMRTKCNYYRVNSVKTERATPRLLYLGMPEFLRWLIDWSPPADVLDDTRFGIKPYAHKDLQVHTDADVRQDSLRSIIKLWLKGNRPGYKTGKLHALELYTLLEDCSQTHTLIAREWSDVKIGKALAIMAENTANAGWLLKTEDRDGVCYILTNEVVAETKPKMSKKEEDDFYAAFGGAPLPSSAA